MSFDKIKFYSNSIEIIDALKKHIYYLGDLQYQMMNRESNQDMYFDEDEFIANSKIKDSVEKIKLAIISAAVIFVSSLRFS